MSERFSLNSIIQSFIALCVIGIIGVFAVAEVKPLVVIALFMIGWGTVMTLRLPPHKLFPFYLIYLMFEGCFKVLSRYNPVIHVGSDILLIVVTLRLFLHSRSEKVANSVNPAAKKRIGTITYFLTIFSLWVAVQFFNPWGLGLLPSLAGLKTYIVPLLSFFVIGYLISEREVKGLVFVLLVLGIIQSCVSIFDWSVGASFLISISSKYADIATEFIPGLPYRPFGTTAVPGAPAVWMSHTLLAALIVSYFLHKKKVRHWPNLWRTLIFVYFPLAITTLIICQVRIIILRFFALSLVASFLISKRYAFFSLSILTVIFTLFLNYRPEIQADDYTHYLNVNHRAQQAIARALTLRSLATFSNARNAAWYLQAFLQRAKSTTQGIGLSRISASSRPWVKLIEQDKFFGDSWRFADNLYLAIFTELGIFGLSAFILLMMAVLWQLFLTGTFFGRLVFFYCLFVLITGYGAEGLLYQPDASLFLGLCCSRLTTTR